MSSDKTHDDAMRPQRQFTARDKRALVGFLDRMMVQEARASVALDNDSRYCTVAGRECPECHRVYNMDLPACSWCGAGTEEGHD